MTSSPSAVPRSRRGPVRWFLEGGWYFPVVVLSLGMLSFVPFVHAAARTRRPRSWLWAVLYTAAVVMFFVLVGSVDVGGLIIGLMIIACVHLVVVRRQVWPRSVAAAPLAASPIAAPLVARDPAVDVGDPAVRAALAARARREEARRLLAADPRLARELRIGRPDLPRQYDDGGLVDLNGAPPQAVADVCGIDIGTATVITDARAHGVPFHTVEDVFSACDVPFALWDRIRDRAVVVPG